MTSAEEEAVIRARAAADQDAPVCFFPLQNRGEILTMTVN